MESEKLRSKSRANLVMRFWQHSVLKAHIKTLIKKFNCQDFCVFSHGDLVACLFETDHRISRKILGEDG